LITFRLSVYLDFLPPPDDLPALPVPFVPASPELFEPVDLLPPEDFAGLPLFAEEPELFDDEPPLLEDVPALFDASPLEALDFEAVLPPDLEELPLEEDSPALLFAPLADLDAPPLFDDELAPLPPLDLPALPVPLVPASPLALLELLFDDEPELLAFDEELPPPFLPPDDLPALPVPFVPASPPSSRPETASAAIFNAPAAAPCAALERISPAASLTASRMPPDEPFFPPPDFVFLLVDSLPPFFAAIKLPPLIVCKT
jgi:hypothetical protein